MKCPNCGKEEMLKKRLDKLIHKTYGSTHGITFKRTQESKYSVTMRRCMIYPAYFKGTYWQDYTLFVSDPGVLMQKLVDYGNEYGDFTEENWDDIARLTRWLVDGGQEFECGFGTVRRLEEDEADVQEKTYSLWVDKPHISPQKNTLYPVVECAKCGFDFADIINNHKTIYRYCPWCGAIMGGKKNNTNDKEQE